MNEISPFHFFPWRWEDGCTRTSESTLLTQEGIGRLLVLSDDVVEVALLARGDGRQRVQCTETAVVGVSAGLMRGE